MAVTVISTTEVSSASTFTYAGLQDHLMILPGAAWVVRDATAVASLSTASTNYLTVDGLLASGILSGNAVQMNANSFVTVGEDGAIRGNANNGFATVLLGADLAPGAFNSNSATLRNAGEITATIGDAVRANGSGVRVENEGLIAGGSGGVEFTTQLCTLINSGRIVSTFGAAVAVQNGSTIVNSGQITSDNNFFGAAVELNGPGSILDNSGLIRGSVAISTATTAVGDTGFRITNTATGTIDGTLNLVGEANDTVVNRGIIDGFVNLGGGNDLFDGRGGQVLEALSGGAGNDTFVLSDADTTLVETSTGGTDLVRSTVDYVLQEFVENLTLIGTADLTGRGNGLANQISGNSGDNRLWGGLENDTLSGLDGDDFLFGGSGNDTLNGGAGNDILYGGLGADRLSGGEDADQFVFGLATHSPPTSGQSDTISGFERGEDLIVLSRIDARSSTGGNDAFTFIGNAAFSNVEGQLRVVVSGSSTQVQADMNGDGVADLIVRLTGAINLTAADFVL
jgi:Ca2+-binding RTX toxin-like protein